MTKGALSQRRLHMILLLSLLVKVVPITTGTANPECKFTCATATATDESSLVQARSDLKPKALEIDRVNRSLQLFVAVKVFDEVDLFNIWQQECLACSTSTNANTTLSVYFFTYNPDLPRGPNVVYICLQPHKSRASILKRMRHKRTTYFFGEITIWAFTGGPSRMLHSDTT